jgi:hypothetical protein
MLYRHRQQHRDKSEDVMHRGLIAGFAAILATALPAATADPAAVQAACAQSTSRTEAACACVAKQAASLSPEQRDYVVAALAEDTDAAAKAEAALSITQFSDVSAFIVNTMTDCGGE